MTRKDIVYDVAENQGKIIECKSGSLCVIDLERVDKCVGYDNGKQTAKARKNMTISGRLVVNAIETVSTSKGE